MTIEEKIAAYADILKNSSMRQKIDDIALFVSWGAISREYFGKSASWMYHKLDGIDGNGGKGGFTPEELQLLKSSLCDLSDRIIKVANSL